MLKLEPRRHQRVLYSVPIRLHYLKPGGVRTSRGISLDISEGGLGALVPSDLMVGEAVEIDLQLRRSSLCAVAIVRHSSSRRSGFEFLGLTPEERRQIAFAMGTD
jgi:c-di-GMP-binding flagellar brake protein YcgR